MTTHETAPGSRRGSSLVIRHSSFREASGFTIMELLIVITIIIVLAALVLGTIGYAQNKAARSRAEAEIAALSAACENYKADNGIYPRGNHDLSPVTAGTKSDTDTVDARTNGRPNAPTTYSYSSLYLYQILSGSNPDGTQITNAKSYFSFKPALLLRSNSAQPVSASNPVTALRDPFGNSYGYSTAYTYDVENNTNPPTHGYNPTFDLWSTAGQNIDPPGTNDTVTPKWIKNW